MAKSSALLRPSQELLTASSKLQVIVDKSPFFRVHVGQSNPLIKRELYRGSIAEVNGSRSSGRSALCLHILAQATARGEVCAVVDLHDSFHPHSAHAAGVKLEHILWVRCRGNAEHTMRAADLLLHAGGFGVVLLDLCEASTHILNRIPLSYWHRFRRAVEHTPTVLLLCADSSSQAKSTCTTSLELKHKDSHWSGKAPFLRLQGVESIATLRKPLSIHPEPLFISSVD